MQKQWQGNSLTREWISGFQRYPLLDLVEITQACLRGRAQGVWVHLQALLWVPPRAGFWVSATQNHNSQHKVFICWFTGTLWSSCMINKLHSTVCILLMMHFPMQLISISEIMCQTHAFAVSLLSLYLGEKFTHSPMSQSLRASDALWCASCLLCFAFWSHGIIMNDDYTALLPKYGQHSSRNSVYERKVYKYSTGKFMFKMCLRKLALFCSQWQAEWFQVFCDTEQSSREASALRRS